MSLEQGLAMYSFLETALKELAIRTLASDSEAKYLAVTGVYVANYDTNATVYYVTGNGKNATKEVRVEIPIPLLEQARWEKYKILKPFGQYFAMKDGFNGCYTIGGAETTLKNVIENGGFALGYDGWSLKNLLETPLDSQFKQILISVANQINYRITNSDLTGTHTIKLEALPSPNLPKLYIAEDWTKNTPATFKQATTTDLEGHITLCLFSKETNTQIGTMETPYPMAQEISTDFNKPYMTNELHAYGKVIEQALVRASNGKTFTTRAGGTFKFKDSADEGATAVSENAIVSFTLSKNPTTVKRQQRFRDMSRYLAEQGITPKTSVNGQPIYELPLANNQKLVVGATFGILYANNKQVGVLYNLEQTSIEQVIASVTLTNNPLLIWLVTSMDLRRGLQPFNREGGRS